MSQWRSFSVCESGRDATERVTQTAAALETIGAIQIATQVRTAKNDSILSMMDKVDIRNPVRELYNIEDIGKVSRMQMPPKRREH